MKTDVKELKESLSFTQNDIDKSFSNINEKVQSLEKVLSSIKEDVGVIQNNRANIVIGNSQKNSGSRR